MRYGMISLFMLFFVLNGCATSYQARGPMGGYEDTQIDKNTIKVTFRGNAYISEETVSNYLLYRCAEVTAEKEYDYFIIIESDGKISTTQLPGQYTSSTTGIYGGGSVTGTTTGIYVPGATLNKPRETALIKMYSGEKPDDNISAYSAREVMKYLGPKVKPQKSTRPRKASEGTIDKDGNIIKKQ
jgi:hypothetical protein